jgi:hypothetical protein
MMYKYYTYCSIYIALGKGSRKPLVREGLSTVDLFFKVDCFIKKVNAIFIIKRS